MAGDRSIKARLELDVSQYKAGLRDASSATDQLGKSTSKASAQGESAFVRLSKQVSKNQASVGTLSTLATGFGLAAGVGVAAVVKTFADFDAQMSGVEAALKGAGLGATETSAAMDQLRSAAVAAGSQTAFSATEAAEGIENLLKAGVGVHDILGGGLKGALDLAAAGELSVADAAEIAATAMTQFKLEGKDVPHIADLLAAGAGKAQGEVSDMAAALKQSGLVASQFGLSIETTTGTLSAFASAGLIGSDAGTSFKSMLLALANPSKESAALMDSLGISAYDAQGRFVGITGLAEQLKQRLGGLSEETRNAAFAQIFGNDAIRAANVLYEQGGSGIADWTKKVDDQGFAAETAATKLDNLKGDVEGFTGALESAFIKSGSGANGTLRDLTQGATDVVNAVGDIPEPVLKTGLAVAGLSGAGLLAVGGLGKLAVAASETKGALTGLGISGKAAGLAAGGVGLAIAAATAGVSYFASKSAESKARVDDFTAALQSQTDAIQENVTKVAGKQLQDQGAFAAARQLGLDLRTVTDAALGQTDAMAKVAQATDGALAVINTPQEYDENAQRSIDAAKVLQDAVGQTGSEYNKAVEEAKDFAAGTAQAGDSNSKAAAATEAQKKAVQDQAKALEDAISELFEYSNALLKVSGGQIGMEAAIDSANKALKENGRTLDLNTEKGRANQTALDQLVSATQENVSSLAKAGASQDALSDASNRGRANYVRLADAMGLSKGAANDLADELFKVPTQKEVKFATPGAKLSVSQAATLNAALKSIPADKRAKIITIAETKGAKAAKQAMERVKDRLVIASTKGKLNGAREVDAAMKRLKDRYVNAVSRGDKKGATEIKRAMDALRSRTVQAKANAVGKGGVDGLRGSVDALRSKTVTVTTVSRSIKGGSTASADGGLITHSTPRLAGGGRVRGRGGPREDNIVGIDRETGEQTSYVSVGEMVTNAVSTRLNYSGLKLINDNPGKRFEVTPLANGGLAGLAKAGTPSTSIAALIAALSNPLARVAAAMATVAAAQRALAAQQRKLVAPRARLTRATSRSEAAKDRQEILRDRVNRLAKAAAATKGTTKADRDLAAARRALARANTTVTKTTRDKSQAQAAYNKVAAPAKAAAERLTEANKALADQNQAVADATRTASDGFRDAYRSGSTSSADWLATMKEGSKDLTVFAAKIAKLRASGLSETLVQQAIGLGALAGGELADDISAGGKGLIASLNAANKGLQAAADKLGYLTATGVVRRAGGGYLQGAGGPQTDSIHVAASSGEYWVNAAGTSKNRALLDRINFGGEQFVPIQAPGVAAAPTISPAALEAAVRAGVAGMSWQMSIDGRAIDARIEAKTNGLGRDLSRSR